MRIHTNNQDQQDARHVARARGRGDAVTAAPVMPARARLVRTLLEAADELRGRDDGGDAATVIEVAARSYNAGDTHALEAMARAARAAIPLRGPKKAERQATHLALAAVAATQPRGPKVTDHQAKLLARTLARLVGELRGEWVEARTTERTQPEKQRNNLFEAEQARARRAKVRRAT